MTIQDANKFLFELFMSEEKKGYIDLDNGKVVLYNIVEQKLLKISKSDEENSIVKIKNAMFNEALIKNLQNKYKTEIFIEGL
jgi:peptidyl-prolyl cis-trans isomerase D